MPAALDEFGGQVEPEDFIAIGWGTLSVSKEIVSSVFQGLIDHLLHLVIYLIKFSVWWKYAKYFAKSYSSICK